MKKILFAALAALAITSCSQNEEIEAPAQKAAMEFNGIVGKTSRASIEDLSTLKNNATGFYVYAYNIGTGTASTEKPIFEKEAIKWNNPKWESDQTYYWPANDKVAFYAYFSPKTIITSLENNTTKTYPQIAGYTVPTSTSNQEDLLVAKIASQDKVTPKVTFQFNHALSQINFSIKPNTLGSSDLLYTIKEITISGVYNKGTYDFETSQWTPVTESTESYVYSISSTQNTVAGDATAEVDIKNDDELMMLLPQTLSDNAKATIKYKVTSTDGETLYYETDAAGKEISLKGSTITEWGNGKKIRYILKLTNDAQAIEWDAAEPTPWGNDSSEEID